MLKSKIHRVTVTEANIHYMGSITVDEELLEAANISENEQVHVVNVNNGERFVTYAIKGKRGSGIICINGAAARLAVPDDVVIIIAYGQLDETQAQHFSPKLVFVNAQNRQITDK